MFFVRSLRLMSLFALLLFATTLTAPLYAGEPTMVTVVQPGIMVETTMPSAIDPLQPVFGPGGGPCTGPVCEPSQPCLGPVCSPGESAPIEIRLLIDPAEFCAAQP